jgi:5'-deoxynucleotidase YfbR-like HD superfamily hydrolase
MATNKYKIEKKSRKNKRKKDPSAFHVGGENINVDELFGSMIRDKLKKITDKVVEPIEKTYEENVVKATGSGLQSLFSILSDIPPLGAIFSLLKLVQVGTQSFNAVQELAEKLKKLEEEMKSIAKFDEKEIKQEFESYVEKYPSLNINVEKLNPSLMKSIVESQIEAQIKEIKKDISNTGKEAIKEGSSRSIPGFTVLQDLKKTFKYVIETIPNLKKKLEEEHKKSLPPTQKGGERSLNSLKRIRHSRKQFKKTNSIV